MIVGAAPVTYPDPGFVILIAVIAPPTTVAVAVAVIPTRLCISFGAVSYTHLRAHET